MKTSKKFAAIAAALAISATTVVPALTITAGAASGGTNKITIGTDTTNNFSFNSFNAYQVFAGTVTDGSISGITWGDGVNSTALLTALKADATIGSDFTSATDASSVADILSGYANNSAKAKAFAKVVAANLSSTTSGTYANNEITGLPDGYYIVTAGAAGSRTADTRTSWTSGLLTLTNGDDATVVPKTVIADVTKKVWEDDGVTFENTAAKATDDNAAGTDNWQDAADAAVGDKVAFKLAATIPSNLSDFEAFYFQLQDELDNGLTVSNSTYAPKYYVVHTDETTGTKTAYAIENTTGNGAVVGNVTSDQSLTFTCYDATEITYNNGTKLAGGDTVVVIYEAVLGEGFKTTPTTGNDNAVTMVYSNNPTGDYTGSDTQKNKDTDEDGIPDDLENNNEISETDKDRVTVLTYNIKITKVDDDGNAITTSSAKFNLKNAQDKYAVAEKDNNGVYVIKSWTDTVTSATEFETTDGIITVSGVDAKKTYTFVETEAPDGYTILNENTNVTIDRTWVTNVDNLDPQGLEDDEVNPLNSLTFTGDTENTSTTDELVGTEITNTKKTLLPTTGGMGTTLFYLGGGVITVGAGALLITKKRMKNKGM